MKTFNVAETKSAVSGIVILFAPGDAKDIVSGLPEVGLSLSQPTTKRPSRATIMSELISLNINKSPYKEFRVTFI